MDDYLAVQILYHRNDSNFKLGTQVANVDTSNYIYMTHYDGISGSIERSIPITRKLGVLASFDLLQIINATSPSTLPFKQTGYGFQIEGEIYYQMMIFSSPFRVGVSYWQQGNENEFDESTSKGILGRNSYFQLARAITINLSTRF